MAIKFGDSLNLAMGSEKADLKIPFRLEESFEFRRDIFFIQGTVPEIFRQSTDLIVRMVLELSLIHI